MQLLRQFYDLGSLTFNFDKSLSLDSAKKMFRAFKSLDVCQELLCNQLHTSTNHMSPVSQWCTSCDFHHVFHLVRFSFISVI